MSDLFGTFSEPQSLSVGDPYRKPKDATGRWAGKQFSTVPPKEGKAPDVYLDKQVRSLALGDRYIDAWILDERLSKKPGKALSEKPFHCRVGAANSSISYGPGSSNGCLSGVAYDTDGSSAALRSNPPRRPADKLRNIYTTAPKKGGYSQPWRAMTLGEPPVYYSDVYEGGREMEKALRKTSKPVGHKPFVSAASKSSRPFTPDPQLFHTGARPQSSPQRRPSSSSSGQQRSTGTTRERPHTAVWRPSSGRKVGAAASSFGIPDYVPDPVREAKYHAKEHAAVKPFRPASGAKARLSMRDVNPYVVDARPAPSIDFTIT